MSPLNTEDDKRRVRQAADFLIRQHGDRAIAEAEDALRKAHELNDPKAIEAFQDILSLLKGSRMT